MAKVQILGCGMIAVIASALGTKICKDRYTVYPLGKIDPIAAKYDNGDNILTEQEAQEMLTKEFSGRDHKDKLALKGLEAEFNQAAVSDWNVWRNNVHLSSDNLQRAIWQQRTTHK